MSKCIVCLYPFESSVCSQCGSDQKWPEDSYNGALQNLADAWNGLIKAFNEDRVVKNIIERLNKVMK